MDTSSVLVMVLSIYASALSTWNAVQSHRHSRVRLKLEADIGDSGSGKVLIVRVRNVGMLDVNIAEVGLCADTSAADIVAAEDQLFKADTPTRVPPVRLQPREAAEFWFYPIVNLQAAQSGDLRMFVRTDCGISIVKRDKGLARWRDYCRIDNPIERF